MRILNKWWDEENGVMVVYIDFPKEVDEFVTANADGSYTAFIRASMSIDRQAIAYTHALWHIEHGDFEDGVDVQIAERLAHARIQEIA